MTPDFHGAREGAGRGAGPAAPTMGGRRNAHAAGRARKRWGARAGRAVRRWRALTWALSLALAAALVLGVGGSAAAAQGGDEALLLSRLAEAFRLIRSSYVQDVPADSLFDAAMRGMLRLLDPNSTYLDAADLEAFRSGIQGRYFGIGVQVEFEGGYTRVTNVFPGSPAERAGIQRGDRFKAVDGKDVSGLPAEAVVPLVRGPAGTKVRLTILRPGRAQPLEFEVERAEIQVRSVQWRMLAPEVGYVKILTFDEDAGSGLEAALRELRAQGARGIVLDLRDNPGGLLGASVEVAQQLVPPGAILHEVGRGSERRTIRSQTPGLGLPLAVLVNGNTASASEVVAGAVQDRGAGVLVGEPTFGKGTVQKVFDLPGSSALKLTVAKYQTAGGRQLERGRGLVPDVPVPTGRTLPAVPDGRALRPGEAGLAVLVLEERLAALGDHPGPVDGRYDAATAAAVRAFQQAHGLPASGLADAATVERLNEDPQRGRDPQLERAQQIVLERIRAAR